MSENPLGNNFNLHLLFDPYIASNLGNPRSLALQYFSDSLTAFLIGTKDEHFVKSITELLQNSLAVDRHMEKLLQALIKIYDYSPYGETIEREYEELLTNFSKSPIATDLNITAFAMENKPKITNKYEKKHLEAFIRTILRYVVNNNVLVNRSLIIPTGFRNKSLHIGHAIGMYYSKVENENYTFTIANSGDGIEYHMENSESKYEIIIEKNNIPIQTLADILVESYLAGDGVLDHTYTAEKYYERVLLPYINPLRSDVPNEMYFNQPQLSGSCTFFGFFYIFYYYFLKGDKTALFKEWYPNAKNHAIEQILKYLIAKDRITSNDKHFIDLLKTIKLTDPAKEKLNNAEEKYISDVENWTVLAKDPDAYIFEYSMKIKKWKKGANPFIEYISLFKKIDNATDLSVAMESLTRLVALVQKSPVLFYYTGIIYLIIKSLVSIYTKKDHMLKSMPADFFEKFSIIIAELQKIKYDSGPFGPRYPSSLYKLSHAYLLIFNIILKINTLTEKKFFIPRPSDNINLILSWINLNYKFEELYGLTPYDLAMNMKDYQHYFLSYYAKNEYMLLNKSVIEAWTQLMDPLMAKKMLSTGPPSIFPDLRLLRITDIWDKLAANALFPTDFLYLISSHPYNFLIYFMLNLFFGGKEYRPIKYFIAIQSEYSESGKAYEFVILNPGTREIFGTESYSEYENDINIFEMIKFSDKQDAKLILNHYEYPDNIKTQNKLLATDAAIILYDHHINSFTVAEGITRYKCLVEKFNWDEISANFNLKILCIILFSYKCRHEIPAHISSRLRELIAESEREYEKITPSQRWELRDYYSALGADIYNGKMIYILITGDLEHEYMASILKNYPHTIPSIYYSQFFELIFKNSDKVPSSIDLWRNVSVDMYGYFITLFKELNKKTLYLGTVVDEIFGDLDLYDIIGKETYQIALIPSHYFEQYSYLNRLGDFLERQYIYYRDQTSRRIYGITNTKHLFNVEIVITKPDKFIVFRKGTDYKYTRLASGFAKNFYDKLVAASADPMLISHNEKINETIITVITHKVITFKIQDNKIFYENYEVITNKYNFAQNQFIYDLPTAFILRKDVDHKILLINCDDKCSALYPLTNLLKSVWINSNSSLDIPVTTEGYQLIDLHYTNCYPIFSNYRVMESYLIYCGIMGKTFCILSFFNQYVQHSLNQSSWNPNLLNFCINNPYKYYFLLLGDRYLNFRTRAKLNILPDEHYVPEDAYAKRVHYYPKRYKMAKNAYSPVLYRFKYSDFLQKLSDKMISISDNGRGASDKVLAASRLNAIDPNYGRYIETFKASYKPCRLVNYPENKTINMLIDDLQKKIVKTQNKIAKIVALSDNHTIPEAIYTHYELFYSHLELLKTYQIISSIHKLCGDKLKQNCECNEIKKFRDQLNTSIIYTGTREINVIHFEILFGSFIRNDQYDIYLQMTNDIANTTKYSIYQMLMGEGKTSVIGPLLVLKYLYDILYANIILTMPSHLKQQSFDLLVDRYGLLLENCFLRNVEIERKDATAMVKFMKKPNATNIIIIDDTSYKAILLNSVEANEIDTPEMKHLRDQSICIMDEIDTMMDPLSSDLNYPLAHRDLDSFITHFATYALNDMLLNSKYQELVFPTATESQVYVDRWFTLKVETYDDIFKNELSYFVMRYIKKSPITLADLNYKIVGQIRKIYTILKDCLAMVYNKDYGFGNEIPKYEKNNFVAIPYKAVGDPVDRSEFTDAEITLCLTILSYHYHKLRLIDLKKLQLFVKGIQTKYGSAYAFIPSNKQLIKTLNKHGFDLQKLADANERELAANADKLTTDRDLINFYLMHIISPQFINITKNQFNCSFIDVLSGTFIKRKIAFSGTVNILLPETLIEAYEFKKITHSDKANGSAISALIGYVNVNNIMYIDEMADIVTKILRIITANNYNVLIDIGAFLRNILPLDFVKLLSEQNETYKRKKYIYIDQRSIKHVYASGQLFPLGENTYATEDIFIYYDNMHIVGIDVKQPYNLKALATIDHFNRLTTVEQGIFRLRNINYGHKIDFLLSNNIPSAIRDPIELLKYLTNKENQYIAASVPTFWMQNIKYLSRQSDVKNQKSYIDNVYYEVIRTKDDLNENLYKKYIRQEYCNYKVKLIKIRNLCDNLVKTITEPPRSTQKQKEVAEEVIVAKEVIVSKSKIDYNKISNIKLDIISEKYSIQDYITISDIIKKLDIPGLFDYLKIHNIYISPDYLNYIKDRPNIYKKTYNKADDIYVELVNNYNFYYIKKLGKQIEYLLITPAEFFNLFIFLDKNRYDGGIIVKHKSGAIKYPVGGEDKPDLIELTIKFVLSNRLTLSEYTKLFEQISAEGKYEQFKNLVDNLTNIYLFAPANKRYIDYFLTQRGEFSAALKTLCDPLNIDKLLEILEINLPSMRLTESDKGDIIKNSGILSCSPGVGGGYPKYQKYRFKSEILGSTGTRYRFKNLYAELQVI
ncbi:MAG: hypothetical protein Harvfovirus9_28 [Harvfovirus sp.]|uniref:DUF3638 domain-containing protein n=1 Tax=Harvfovirus sp. TaxID=2487768 RepID=A0A3G5A108_9VIRU|nr:MAG: hypothetical protein Harvfovirus9_28 [Harvfovirus sp.]